MALKLKEQLPQIILKNKSQIESIKTQMPKKDSLQIWFKPLKVDSLTSKKHSEDFVLKIKRSKKDSQA
jgi:hypothetical protein